MNKNPAPMPTLFLSHGAPDMSLRNTPAHRFLQGLPRVLPAPKAILAVSAHWETEGPMLTSSPRPETIHDFGGFPDALYRISYDAPGAPALAGKARALLGPGAEMDAARGLDHGAWSPLRIMWPEARIPVVQLSVQPRRDAAHHYNLGRMLAPLRDEGVLIVASGNATHNLREAFRGGHTSDPPQVAAFTDWLYKALAEKNHAALLGWSARAPHALWNHPTPEHFLPLFVALGAAGPEAVAERLHDSIDMMVLAMDSYAFS
jgi:4,5-DOPA dioxygenase extradiol